MKPIIWLLMLTLMITPVVIAQEVNSFPAEEITKALKQRQAIMERKDPVFDPNYKKPIYMYIIEIMIWLALAVVCVKIYRFVNDSGKKNKGDHEEE